MKYIYILLFSVIACSRPHVPQVSTSTYCYLNNNNDTIRVCLFSIMNSTREDYYTWIDFDYKKSSNDSNEIKQFFLKRKGDFSLLSLWSDNVIISSAIIFQVGKDFLKKIGPGDTFKYILYGPCDEYEFEEFKQHVFIKTQKEIESVISFEIPDYASFPESSIALFY